MLPTMCDTLPCMNMELRIVIKCLPAAMSAGTSAHFVTKGSPPNNSNRNTSALTAMIDAVTTGIRYGRREASLSGITPMVPLKGDT